MKCTICNEEYYPQTTLDPAEPCLCGQMAWGSPWQWDKWQGIYNWFRYYIARQTLRLYNFIIMKGYRK